MKTRITKFFSAIQNILGIKAGPKFPRAIMGVATSVTVFIGLASSGEALKPKQLSSYADYEREFGPPHPNSDLATAVRLFFLNGGTVCYVVNIKTNPSHLTPFDDVRKLYRAAIRALEPIDMFNLLVITKLKRTQRAQFTDQEYLEVLTTAGEYCRSKRAFLLVDPLDAWDQWDKITADPGNLAKLRALKNAAVYFPRLKTREVDTETERERSKIIGPAAAVAGIMARIDATRGVWKAPAGILAEIRGIEGLDISLTTQQIGNLSKQGVNSIRTFDTRTLCWGARTVVGYAHGDPEWKYLPVRRLALYIEESLNRGTDWVVFEPNDEPTWAVIRMSVGTFMFDLFRQGAFQGVSPKDAFFVKCDGQTTTQADQNRGIVNITVGFAPLKPAEFVIFKIQKTMVET